MKKKKIIETSNFDIGERVYFIRKYLDNEQENDVLDDGIIVGLSYRRYKDDYHLENVEIEYINYGIRSYTFVDVNYVFKTKQDAYIYLIENAKFIVKENAK